MWYIVCVSYDVVLCVICVVLCTCHLVRCCASISQVYAGLSAAQIIDRVANQGLRPKAPRGGRAHTPGLEAPPSPTMCV